MKEDLGPQCFLVAAIGDEVPDGRVLDALPGTRAIAATVVAHFPPGHGIADGGERVLHQELRVARAQSLGKAVGILRPARWRIPCLVTDGEKAGLNVNSRRSESQ